MYERDEREKQKCNLTIWTMLLDNLHNAYDGWYFATRVIKESQIALLHGTKIIAS